MKLTVRCRLDVFPFLFSLPDHKKVIVSALFDAIFQDTKDAALCVEYQTAMNS